MPIEGSFRMPIESVTQNYNSFGVVNDPNSLTDSLRDPPSVSDDPNDSGSDLEEDDLKSALGKRRRDGKSALPQPLTSIQHLYISRLVEKYGADFQRMMMDIKLNPMQHSVATLEKLFEAFCETMTTPYENSRLKRIAENKKKLAALNLPTLSQSLHKSSESSSKPSLSVKGRSRFVQPGEIEVNKKKHRLRIHSDLSRLQGRNMSWK
ncbi:unnamed protein product [Vicia faba]|uniref:Nucleolar protein 16 n=1 Tax=Vicia faba TaxID=3906 RepID=A0AAV0ZFS9_VICFA|nr:unnamed protein product [Vicia faba]